MKKKILAVKKVIKKRWKLTILLAILVIVGIWFFGFRNKNKEVKTATVQRGKIAEELILSGTVTATNYAKLSFETPGKIIYVGVTEGEQVNKGRLISKLDSTVLNSSYQIALSNLRIAQATVENVHDQVKGNDDDESFVQKDLRTTAEASKDKAYEAVMQAKRNLDGANLYAPFNGIITYLNHPFSGVYSSAGSVEAEIIDPRTIYLEVLADQNEVTKLFEGQKVDIILDSFEDKTFQGLVKTISFSPITGEAGSSYPIKVSFEKIDLLTSRFKIGMTADAKFIVSEKEDTLYVDSSFVNSDRDGKYIYTKPGNGKVYVEVGMESENFSEIKGDISEGQALYD